MNLEETFRLSSIMLVASAFTGLILTGELPMALVVLGLLGLAASLMQAGGRGQTWIIFRLSREAWNALIVVALAALLADLLWISQDVLVAGVHFLVFLMVNKLLTLRERKDFLQLYAISLVELLAAAALTVELWYAVVFATYLLAAIWTLLLYHLRTEAEDVPVGHSGGQTTRMPGTITVRFFWTTNGIALGAFCLTLTIFFLTPRVGAGFFHKNRVELIRTSGFSDRVDLGVIGAVKLDQSVVMRVEFPELQAPPPGRFYLRGAAYDLYDGRSWHNSLSSRRVLGRTAEGLFRVFAEGPGRAEPVGLRQDILIEALDTAALFGGPFVQSIMGNFLVLQADGMGSLNLPYPPSARFQYSVWSTPARLSEHERTTRVLEYPDDVRVKFLQLPAVTPRVAQLAREVTPSGGTTFDAVEAVERHLREHYQYSLDVGTTFPASPVEEFLFVRRSGYCEHYATAMVVMLRTLGIPARLATGFLAGEWNDFGSYLTVRQRDAHAWVEVFFPRSGWLTFDPTPNVGAASTSPYFARVGLALDSIRLKWDRFVIQYSFRDQMAVAREIREQGDVLRSQFSGTLAAWLRWLSEARSWIAESLRLAEWAIAGWVMGCAGIALVLVLWVRKSGAIRWGRGSLERAGQAVVTQLYTRLLRLLESRGICKAPGTTPTEFARFVESEWREASPHVHALTRLYCHIRFGQATVSPLELQRATSLLAEIRALRRSAKGR
jgi:transglutaminase-like putative cysteine protease